MAYVRHRLAALIEVDPVAAKREIAKAFVNARASRADAASLLSCRRSTFMQWVAKLGMGPELDAIETEAKQKGWHHGRLGGAGCHKKRTSSTKS